MRASNVEEANSHGAPDPWEVFTQLAILIIEGRTPGGEKGYHAGPHCSFPHQAGANRHVCDPNLPTCARVESLLRQLRLMWGVGVGVSVEVLVAPECEHGAAFSNTTLDATTAPSPLLSLIEQWNFTIYDRNIPEATSTGWSVVAAVRSFLHFSQLSAWLSISGGSRPANILYRLTVPSPVFCSKFESEAEEHTFPVANFGQDTAIKVVVRSVPRSSHVPVVICHEPHENQQLNIPYAFSLPVSSMQYQPLPSSVPVDSNASTSEAAYQHQSNSRIEGSKAEEDLRRSMMRARLGDPSRAGRSESPDTQLGESLLDPPNSLSRIPRRFQSPSRSGSPSLETPEHIICKVRQPGPSHGRPPDIGTFCQPLVFSTQQPLNPFSWTQTRYPSFAPVSYNPQPPIHSEIFHNTFIPSEPLHVDQQFSRNGGGAFTPYPSSSNPQPFYTAPQSFWSHQQHDENIPLQNKVPASLYSQHSHSSQLYQLLQKSDSPPPQLHLLQYQTPHQSQPSQHHSLLLDEKTDQRHQHHDNRRSPVMQPHSNSPPNEGILENCFTSDCKSETFAKFPGDQNFCRWANSIFSPASVNTASSAEVKSFALKNNVSRAAESVDAVSESSDEIFQQGKEGHGTKRKGAYGKESPKNKRESPPHIYYSKEAKGDNDMSEVRRRGSGGDGDDLLKRKNEDDDTLLGIDLSNRRRELVSDQLMPRCSVQGKHLCSSEEDLMDIKEEDTDFMDFKPNAKSLRNERRTSPCSKFEDAPNKFSFDLTPKETQEILSVLRQNTTAPPLRINNHRNSADHISNKVIDRISIEKDSKGLKMRRKSEDILDEKLSRFVSLTVPVSKSLEGSSQQPDTQSFWCHSGEVRKTVQSQVTRKSDGEAAPTSSNKSCDTSFKKPSNCTCNNVNKCSKTGGNYNDAEYEADEDDDDDTIEDGLSFIEIEKMRTSKQSSSTDCIQARTITQKASFFTANSQPTSKTTETLRQTSQALMKSPLSSVLSTIRSVTLQGNQIELKEECKRRARRVLNFDDHSEETQKDTPVATSCNSFSASSLLSHVAASGRESTREGFAKSVSIIKQLMKKNILCTHEQVIQTKDVAKYITEPSDKVFQGKEVSVEGDENVEEKFSEQLQNGHEKFSIYEPENNFHVNVPSVTETASPVFEEDKEVEDLCRAKGIAIPSASEKVKFRRSLDSAATLVFHNKTGLPLTSSPAPLRKGKCFDFDSSLNSVAAIRSAFRACDEAFEEIDIEAKDKIIQPLGIRSVLSASAPASVVSSNLLGNFEECVLNGRLEPVSTVQGFSTEIAASGAFCPKHLTKPVTVFFYTLCDNDQISSPYMGHINLGKKGYHIPNQGTVQVTLFNPHGTVVKMFVVVYDLSDMPPNSKTFLRQRTLNMPIGASDTHSDAHQWLRYLIHLRFASSKSGKIYLHTDIRMLIFRKSDADAATLHKNAPFELRSFTRGPVNPKFSPRK